MPQLTAILLKLGGIILSSFLGAIGLFLSRVLEPMIAWFSFTTMKLLIKVTGSDTLRSLYGDMKKGYETNRGIGFYQYSPLNTNDSESWKTDKGPEEI
jgi:hypothetical protein